MNGRMTTGRNAMTEVFNWTNPEARDALAEIFEHGFEHAEEGRPYDYADEIIRRLHEAGFVINPVQVSMAEAVNWTSPEAKWRKHCSHECGEALEDMAEAGAAATMETWPTARRVEVARDVLAAAGVPEILAGVECLRDALQSAVWAWDARKSSDPGHARRRADHIKQARATLDIWREARGVLR